MFLFNKNKTKDTKKQTNKKNKDKNKEDQEENEGEEEEEYPPDVELFNLEHKLVDIKAQLGDKFTIIYNQQKSLWDTQQTQEKKEKNLNKNEDDSDDDSEDEYSQHDIQIVKSKIQKEQKRREELLFEQQEREVEFKEFKRKFMIFEIKNQMLESLVQKEKKRYDKYANYKDFDFEDLDNELQQQNLY